MNMNYLYACSMFKVIREKCGDWLDGYTQISTKKGEHICA